LFLNLSEKCSLQRGFRVLIFKNFSADTLYLPELARKKYLELYQEPAPRLSSSRLDLQDSSKDDGSVNRRPNPHFQDFDFVIS
jgi:hypothetical protein